MAKKSTKTQGPNFWGMLRDVLIASINKGQFPLACLTLFGMLIIYRMPGPDVSQLVFRLEEHFANGSYIGYMLAVLFGGGWLLHARWQRRIIASEMNRIGEEKSSLHKELEIKIESSKQ